MVRLTEPKDGEPIDAKALEQQLFEAEQAAYDAPTRDKVALAVLNEVHETLRAYTWTADKLSETALRIHSAMEDLLRYLSKYGRADNSLGTLQASGPELDRLCGELACRREALTRMVRVANATLAD